MWALLRSCVVTPFTEQEAHGAGAALARSGANDVVDAVVALAAGALGTIVTSDPVGLAAIVHAIGSRAESHVV